MIYVWREEQRPKSTLRAMSTFLPMSQGHCMVIQQPSMARTPTQHSASENKVHGAQVEGNAFSTYVGFPEMWIELRMLQIPPSSWSCLIPKVRPGLSGHSQGRETRPHKRQPWLPLGQQPPIKQRTLPQDRAAEGYAKNREGNSKGSWPCQKAFEVPGTERNHHGVKKGEHVRQGYLNCIKPGFKWNQTLSYFSSSAS